MRIEDGMNSNYTLTVSSYPHVENIIYKYFEDRKVWSIVPEPNEWNDLDELFEKEL